MDQAMIKIVSNPYQRNVYFQRCIAGEWTDLSLQTDARNNLIGSKFTQGFFPFKAAEIARIISDDFGNGIDPVRVIFEGPSDEYQELSDACKGELEGRLMLEYGSRCLPNAREVLPNVVALFRKIEPLLQDPELNQDSIKRDIKKFVDASSEKVPLCVVGNYSAGKSMFINALIGLELLPSGSDPVTARVYQVSNSKEITCGKVELQEGARTIRLFFNASGLVPSVEYANSALYDQVQAACAKVKPDLVKHMNRTIKVINSYQPDEAAPRLSDWIEIEAPFCVEDPWFVVRDFVIFDTPGSNSATNTAHFEVLRAAMEGLSNGLPIYVTDHRSLDTRDNQHLYEEITKIEALDERFAMIVVNRADEADLLSYSDDDDYYDDETERMNGFSPGDVARIMDLAVPRKLYAQGIFYVSSILGLGAKTHGRFASRFCAEKYADNERRFSDPECVSYRSLYRYNILPDQIAQRTVRESEACDQLMLANSGLFCIEQEIVRFADRYSAYNKCLLSVDLLKRISLVASDAVVKLKEQCKAQEERLQVKFDEQKAELRSAIASCSQCVRDQALCDYDAHMKSKINPVKWNVDIQAIREHEHSLVCEKRQFHDVDEHNREVRDAAKSIGPELLDAVQDVIRNPCPKSIESARDSFVSSIEDTRDKGKAYLKADAQALKEASDELVKHARSEYVMRVGLIEAEVDELSRAYWLEHSLKAKEELNRIATESQVLSEDKRTEIVALIRNYEELCLEKNTGMFNFDDLEFGLRFWGEVIIGSNRIDVNALASKFNREIAARCKEAKQIVNASHRGAFATWLSELTKEIDENIESYNPTLRSQAAEITELKERIGALEQSFAVLQESIAAVEHMIEWEG